MYSLQLFVYQSVSKQLSIFGLGQKNMSVRGIHYSFAGVCRLAMPSTHPKDMQWVGIVSIMWDTNLYWHRMGDRFMYTAEYLSNDLEQNSFIISKLPTSCIFYTILHFVHTLRTKTAFLARRFPAMLGRAHTVFLIR